MVERGIENCAYCGNFECDSLKTRTGFLDEYLKRGVKKSEEDYKRYVLPYASKERLLKIKEKVEDETILEEVKKSCSFLLTLTVCEGLK